MAFRQKHGGIDPIGKIRQSHIRALAGGARSFAANSNDFPDCSVSNAWCSNLNPGFRLSREFVQRPHLTIRPGNTSNM
jgi:hypothetical protein